MLAPAQQPVGTMAPQGDPDRHETSTKTHHIPGDQHRPAVPHPCKPLNFHTSSSSFFPFIEAQTETAHNRLEEKLSCRRGEAGTPAQRRSQPVRVAVVRALRSCCSPLAAGLGAAAGPRNVWSLTAHPPSSSGTLQQSGTSAHSPAWGRSASAWPWLSLTVKVDATIVVLVRVLHHVLYVLIGDVLPGGPQDLAQLLDVDEPIRVPVGG